MVCIYCGAKIDDDNKSKEHIINNGLGGLIESYDICCNKCNNIVEKSIDNGFCKIFSPIVTQITNMKKSRKSEIPTCKGRAKNIKDGIIYDVIIREKKVVDCIEYKKKYKQNIDKNEFRILSYYFDLINDSFKQGMIKTAFNFSIYKGIPLNFIKDIVNVKKNNNTVESISFKAPMIPFYPCNAFDKYLELDTRTELFHTLILFSHKNILACYIDLFNTFQCYVILSSNWTGGKIYETYLQLIKKIDRTVPKLQLNSIKDIYITSAQYNVNPTFNTDEIRKNIKIKINLEPYENNLYKFISNRVNCDYSISDKFSLMDKVVSINFYMDENDFLKEKLFRVFTPRISSQNIQKISFYIDEIQKMEKNGYELKKYTYAKLDRLNQYLIEI